MTHKTIFWHRLQRPIDCAALKSTRGIFIGSRILENTDGLDFEGSVLYRCYPSNLKGALEIEPSVSREELTPKGLDLSGFDFSEMELQGLTFSGAVLDNADFSEANLEGVDFSNTSLNYADFAGADLSRANFTRAVLENSCFDGATINGADFTDATLDGADFEHIEGYEYSNLTTDQVMSLERGLNACSDCSDILPTEDFVFTSDSGEVYCEDCVSSCESCGELGSTNTFVMRYDGRYVCADCIEVYQCDVCDYESQHLENFQVTDEGEYLCEDCAIYCKECEETVRKDECEKEVNYRGRSTYYHKDCYEQCNKCLDFIPKDDFQDHLEDCTLGGNV